MDLMERYYINLDNTEVNILKRSTTPILGGTSADLLENDKLTIRELLYGMMLPSGNDAAESLAIYFGSYIMQKDKPVGPKKNEMNRLKREKFDANIYED